MTAGSLSQTPIATRNITAVVAAAQSIDAGRAETRHSRLKTRAARPGLVSSDTAPGPGSSSLSTGRDAARFSDKRRPPGSGNDGPIHRNRKRDVT